MKSNLAVNLTKKDSKRAQEILQSCVHCGMCLATCPSYQITKSELDSPRGRIYLIKSALEGNEVTQHTQKHLDQCLLCQKCEVTCPAGVEYSSLYEIGKKFINQSVVNPKRKMIREIVSIGLNPWLFKFALSIARLTRPILPNSLAEKIPKHKKRLKEIAIQAEQAEKSIVLLHGCLHDAIDENANQALINLFQSQNIKVHSLKNQCCGAMDAHLLEKEDSINWVQILKKYQKKNFLGMVSSASACNLHLKNHSNHTADLYQLIASFQLKTKKPKTLSLHLPCTLNNGLKKGDQLVAILKNAGYQVRVDPKQDYCCGSAGAYSLLNPKIANQLGKNKAASLNHPDTTIVSANVGCIAQINSQLKNQPVIHWLELLAKDCL